MCGMCSVHSHGVIFALLGKGTKGKFVYHLPRSDVMRGSRRKTNTAWERDEKELTTNRSSDLPILCLDSANTFSFTMLDSEGKAIEAR